MVNSSLYTSRPPACHPFSLSLSLSLSLPPVTNLHHVPSFFSPQAAYRSATCRADTRRLTLHTRYRRRYNDACDDRRRCTLGRRAQDTYSLHYHVFTLRILGNPVALADHARYDVRDFARNTLQPTPSSCESCARDRSSDSNSHFDHDTLALAFSRARPPLPINSSSLHRATLANAHVTMTKSVV